MNFVSDIEKISKAIIKSRVEQVQSDHQLLFTISVLIHFLISKYNFSDSKIKKRISKVL
jgi:hypothetical protein